MTSEEGTEPTPATERPARRRRRGAALGAALVLAAGAGAWALVEGVRGEPVVRAAPTAGSQPERPRPRPQIVRAVPPGEAPADASSAESEPSAPASDDEVRDDVRRLQAALRAERSVRGKRAGVDEHGNAIAPAGAPEVVAQVVEAGNLIARKPYRYGGGHGGWRDSGYDCSGSISFALAGAGLLDRPLDSSGFMRWGSAGRGRWITVYANPGHAFMVVAGLRFDTSGRGDGGTRWQASMRGAGGYRARHPAGL
jgi:cell wall-associated NlpC family hydrolase